MGVNSSPFLCAVAVRMGSGVTGFPGNTIMYVSAVCRHCYKCIDINDYKRCKTMGNDMLHVTNYSILLVLFKQFQSGCVPCDLGMHLPPALRLLTEKSNKYINFKTHQTNKTKNVSKKRLHE